MNFVGFDYNDFIIMNISDNMLSLTTDFYTQYTQVD